MRFLRSFAAAAVVAAFMGAAVASPVVQEGTGVGKHGDVKVAVTFDNGKIQDIKVLSQKENPVLAAGLQRSSPGSDRHEFCGCRRDFRSVLFFQGAS